MALTYFCHLTLTFFGIALASGTVAAILACLACLACAFNIVWHLLLTLYGMMVSCGGG